MNTQNKTCQNCHQEFTIESDDFAFYEKMKVPAPTFCWLCRYKRRIIWRNVWHLFRGKDAITGKTIFTGVPPEAGLTLYEMSYWNSDNWDAMDYGRDYDFSKPFFEQMRELLHAVPHPSKSMLRSVNSDYSNMADDMKNAYLCFNATFMEDCAYCCNGSHLKNCFDITGGYDSEFCYDNVRVNKSYHTVGSVMSENCVDVWFSKNCIGCTNCFGCVNQRNYSYKIFNEQYSKEEYFEKIKEFSLDTWKGFFGARTKAESFWSKFPIKYMLGFRNQNVTGEDIQDSKNVKNSYIVQKGENLKYVQDVSFGGASNSYDYTCWGISASQLYECMICGEQVDRLKFCWECWPSCQELEYCMHTRRSSNCFGCVGVKDKQYCILNKQYTKEEYEALVEKIKKHMDEMPYTDARGRVYKYGEFFPSELSPFAYNETLLNDQFPSNKEGAEKDGFVWRDENKKEYETNLLAKNLPESIGDVEEKVTQELIACFDCNRAYRITVAELQFLKNSQLPLPRQCFNCRFARRQKFMVSPLLQNSQCQCRGEKSLNQVYLNTQKHGHGAGQCPNFFETAYSPEKEIIYCEECYKKEVF